MNPPRTHRQRDVRRVASAFVAVLVGSLGVACTDLTLDGDEQLSCGSNADCPKGLLCAVALQRCVDEAIVADIPIAVEGDAVVDAPRISRVEGFARAVVTVTFSKAPTGEVVALVDNRLQLACAADEASPKTQRCALDARDFPEEVDGAYDIVVVGTDGAGNEARARARVELDTTAPGLAPDSVVVSYQSVGASLVRDVNAVGPATRAVVQLSLTEVAASTPILELVDGNTPLASLVRDDTRSSGPLQVFVLDGASLGIVTDGVRRLRLTAVDDVGNVNPIDIGEDVIIDASAPAPAVVDVDDAVVFTRVPWGTRAAPEPLFRVTGAAGAAEAGATVVVTSGESLSSSLLGTVAVLDDGSFDATLQVIDVPRVFVRVVDGAANVGAPARVRDVVWTASLGGRLRSDDFSNPHALFNVTEVDGLGLSANLRDEPLRPGDLVDGDGFVVDALPRRRDVRTVASGQPSRMAGSMGYLPAPKLAVIFGGVSRRNGAQVTDTFVLRNDRWSAIVENPPATGPLVYDSTREELVTLLVNGDTWAFDGLTWLQRPVARLPVAAGGPIAFDPVTERVVAVQGNETWVLGDDDVWQRLASDAPIAGVRTFDGLNTTAGSVVAFDGVDGHVILYGNEAGAGAVYALVEDTWTRLGDAPAVTSTTAVEDAETGRVHFVCRSTNVNLGEMLTWDGAAMQTGPADPEPLTGCGATFDVARRRLLAHGGTNDPFVNVQALPQSSISVLEAGAVAWTSISAAIPAQTPHNSGGAWHYNPILERVLLRGAFTGALFSRTTTLWDGETATPAGSASSFAMPFFDGVNSRLVDGSFGQIFVDNAWLSQPLPFTAPVDAVWAYDEDADGALGFGGFTNVVASSDTYRIRGDVFTVLPTTTRPPHRTSGAIAYDVANQRMVMAGGRVSFSAPLHDAWAFEDGDWHQLDDLPLGAEAEDVQLVYDRARGAMMAFIKARLFDLRGGSWVERAVEVLPRDDAMAVYDEATGDLLFVGGLDFEFIVTTMNRIDIVAARAGQVAVFDVSAAGAADDAAFDDVTIDVEAGATGEDDAGAVHGVDLLVWGTSSFVPLAANTAPASAAAAFSVTKTRAELGGALRDSLVVMLQSAPTGPGVAPARLVGRQLEVTLRYQEP